ncbi:2-succinyl-5-enolpyruvyl-6-hydroxy-3-cyclohexene-1-carboxylic-acid synthase [Luteimicrobium sp. NPDC057192]|uniref:2-succinyl-5-enolpyruvyl-6-hydroxy-3- cyclohexene-1-carboxylic-acid synthase n=1 Tax=Luteimicrobium sp. NPDC057192 TaxID=3346042 RepID=UPI0036425352
MNPADALPGDPPAVTAARRLLDALVALGVRDVVVAPGSRSAPLAYAASDLADAGRLHLHVRVDERDAGFLALGLARGSALGGADPVPTAVVTTSGTAVANLHPAVLEAHHAGVPLVLLTADRPHELRGTRANQTTDQVGIFAGATRLTVDVPAPSGLPTELRDLGHLAARAVAAARGTRTGHPGPVHLDLAYREPLVPASPSADGASPSVDGASPSADGASPSAVGASPSVVVASPSAFLAAAALPADLAVPVAETVVVAGDGAGPVARRLAAARGWPLLAEPSSGAWGGPQAVAAHRLVLGVLGAEVRRVVVLGNPTLSRPVQRLLGGALASAGERVEVVVVAPGSGPWPDAARAASHVLPGVPEPWLEPATLTGDGPAAAWTARWRAADAAVRATLRPALDALRSTDGGALDPVVVADAVARASGPDDVLLVGASSPVRDLDLVAAWGEPPHVVANRGLAGIDGSVSTAVGLALAARRAGLGRVRAYLGDLTFLHDVGGLHLAGDDVALQVVVANDGGGSIFSTLEPGALAADLGGRSTFERVFSTPHSVDLGLLVRAYGASHVRVDARAGSGSAAAALDAALAAPAHGLQVVEVVVDRAGRVPASGDALARRVQDAVRGAVPILGENPGTPPSRSELPGSLQSGSRTIV